MFTSSRSLYGSLLCRLSAPNMPAVRPRSSQQSLLMIAACCGGMLPMVNLAMVSSTFLALSGDFNADLIDLARLVLGNVLIMGLVQPLITPLHALLGLRGGLLLALTLLIVSGVATAFAGSLPEMTLWYALTGFGGGLFMSLSVRIVFTIAPAESRGFFMAIWTFAIGFGSNLSPILSGVLVEFTTWRALFLLSPLVGIPCLFVVLRYLPNSRPTGLPPFDWCSFALLVAFAVASLFILCYGQTFGWNSTFILCMLFCAASALFLFLLSCLSAKAPLLHLEHLLITGVSPALFAAVLLIIGHVGMRVQMILFMRNVLAYPPSQIGLMFLVPFIVFLLTLIPAGLVVPHSNPKPFILIGFTCIMVAALQLSRLDANAGWMQIVLPLSLRSFGFALGNVAMTPLLLRNVPPEKQPQILPVINCLRFFIMCTFMGSMAIVSVQLNKWYLARLASQVTEASVSVQSTLAHWAAVFAEQGLSTFQAHRNALSIITSSVKKQATVFTFDHLFLLLALSGLFAILFTLSCRRVNPHPTSSALRHAARSGFVHAILALKALYRKPIKKIQRQTVSRAGLPLVLLFLAIPLAIPLTGCTVGPDYVRPEQDLPAISEDAPGLLFTKERWWEVFQDAELNRLEEAALAQNNNLAQAMARVEQSAAAAGIAFADRLPSAGIRGQSGRRQMTEPERRTHNYPHRTQDSFGGTFFLSFELDLWGKYRRLDEAAQAELLSSEAARDTVRLSVTSETALTYFQLRTLQEQRRIVKDMLEAYDRTCKVYETRYRIGQSPETTFRRFVAERAKTQTLLSMLEDRQIRCEGTLAMLAGYSPADIIEQTHDGFQNGLNINQLAPPPDVPSGLPSDLLLRRPDVRTAEGRLMAANARIGAAQAAFLPSFSLTGESGYASTRLDSLFTDPANIWNIAGGLVQPVFQGGRLKARERMAQAQYAEARAAYLLSVQNAFRETREALSGNRISRELIASSTEQVHELTRSNDIMEKQYDAGLSSVMDLLDVRRQLLSARQDHAEARRQQLAAVVQLCKALGGGWHEVK